jgi:hypothetical protein
VIFLNKIQDGFYFMLEIGWFIDLLIPTCVRVKECSIYLVGSKTSNCKNLKPCCIPCGGSAEVKTLSLDDPSVRAFKTTDSLVPIRNVDDLAEELQICLENKELRDKYLNTKAKLQREATVERILSDYRVLSEI